MNCAILCGKLKIVALLFLKLCFLRRAGWRHFYVTVCLRLFFSWSSSSSKLKEERYYRNLLWIWWATTSILLFWRKWDWGWHKINFVESRLLGLTFLVPLFLSTLKDALRKKKSFICENSGFIAFLKLGEMESWLPFRILIERLSFKELWITDYIQGRKDLLLSW